LIRRRRVGLIINPISGRGVDSAGAAAGRAALARARLAGSAEQLEIVLTTRRGHAAEASRRFVARGFDHVIAWGGDGTANEAAGPLIATGISFGLVPSGSGNGFARALRLPSDPDAALHAAMSPAHRHVDVGWLGNRHFLNVAGIGLDAWVAERFNAGPRRGGLRYVTATVPSFWRCPAIACEVSLGQDEIRGDLLLVAFANGPEYGNGVTIAPDARVDDGWLEAVVVRAASPVRQIWRARRLLFRPGRRTAGIHRAAIQEAVVRAATLPCHVDGETFEIKGEVRARVQGAALIVAAPELTPS
jgi:YegS/Rv2252/BmrU family lipid kinase